jgi:hypothetical protein
MNSRHITFITTTVWPRRVANWLTPQPGVPGG